MSLTSVGFNPYLQTCNAFDHAFPVKAKGWGVTHWDCDLIWDDEVKTSTIRIRRNAEMWKYGANEQEPTREGLEVRVTLKRKDATRDELETALVRALKDGAAAWCKSAFVGREGEHYFPGDALSLFV